jgi:hypothetical protein
VKEDASYAHTNIGVSQNTRSSIDLHLLDNIKKDIGQQHQHFITYNKDYISDRQNTVASNDANTTKQCNIQ